MVVSFGGLLEVVMIVVRNFLAYLILIQKNLKGLEYGKKIVVGLKKKFGWARFGPKGLNGARGTQRGRFRPRKKKKNPINNRVGSGSRLLARGSGLGMQKTRPVSIPSFVGLNTYHEC